jgi:hypothetical protein
VIFTVAPLPLSAQQLFGLHFRDVFLVVKRAGEITICVPSLGCSAIALGHPLVSEMHCPADPPARRTIMSFIISMFFQARRDDAARTVRSGPPTRRFPGQQLHRVLGSGAVPSARRREVAQESGLQVQGTPGRRW